MREEIVNLDNNISIHISCPVLPPLEEGVAVEHRRRLLSDMHLHNEYEFLRVNRGVFRCVTLDGEFVLHEGDIIFINKYVPHSTFEETSDTHSTLIQFRLPSEGDSITRYISRFTSISDTPACVFKKEAPGFDEIRQSFDTILLEYSSKKPFWSDYIYNHMLMLISALRRQGVISDQIQKKREEINKLRPVLEYINDNCGESLSTADLSNMFNFNEQYFCRLFKNIVGTSPINYINFVRVSKAEKLLKTETSLLKVANDMGFSSLSYFNRVFKKYKHYSPGEYKKIIRAREFE